MKCINCDSKTRVVNSRRPDHKDVTILARNIADSDRWVFRRRECSVCGFRFNTAEISVDEFIE